MTIRVSFELGDADLQHLAEVAQVRQSAARSQPVERIVAAAREVYLKCVQAHLADFVKERYSRLGTMLEMVDDAEWRLSQEDSQRLVNALACFTEPAADASSALDQAIMIELVSRDLHHDLEAYRDFCKFREAQIAKRHSPPGTAREEWLSQRRETLQKRMHTRRKRDLDAAAGPVRRLFSLFGL
ncbi:hypothetical protein JM946_22680 [Steroidobacter sp. S1-65]|uniref:Uncharacterized protein n=1 Tax=Steroidobacter gossypii TaxID=2805490 RepID=A0ABS1X2V5_9GAMM|nr:hypothetical protein [Steroidobacter gossypii]MBM0107557.1 hypothetical protein [Steroidobacter gossypii]